MRDSLASGGACGIKGKTILQPKLAEEQPNEGKGGADRRLPLRTLARWRGGCRGRQFPRLEDFHPQTIDFMRDCSFVLDVGESLNAPLISYSGQLIDLVCGGRMEGTISTSHAGHTIFFHIADHHLEVISNRTPIGVEGEYTTQDGVMRRYRGILAPVSENGEDIDHIVGAVSWVDGEPEA